MYLFFFQNAYGVEREHHWGPCPVTSSEAPWLAARVITKHTSQKDEVGRPSDTQVVYIVQSHTHVHCLG